MYGRSSCGLGRQGSVKHYNTHITRVQLNNKTEVTPAILSRDFVGPSAHAICIQLWDSFDACGVSSCGIWAGRRPSLGSSRAERSVSSVKVDGA